MFRYLEVGIPFPSPRIEIWNTKSIQYQYKELVICWGFKMLLIRIPFTKKPRSF